MTRNKIDTFDVIAQVEQGVTVNKVTLKEKDLIDTGESFADYSLALMRNKKHHPVLFSEETYILLKQKGMLKKP